jgi:hypothetical protein
MPPASRARALLAAAGIGAERLESAANLAFSRVAALTERLARLEELGGSREPVAGEAAALEAVTVCRQAKVLLRYVSSRQWPAGRVVANGGRRALASPDGQRHVWQGPLLAD